MNTIKLNTIGTPIGGANSGSGGGGTCNYKYYSCAAEDAVDSLDIYQFGIAKYKDGEGNILLGPSAFSGEGVSLAFAIDSNLRCVLNDVEMSICDFIKEHYGVNLNSYVEITKDEFFHIPQDVHWDCTTEQGIKEIFDNLYPIVQRYGVEYLQNSGIFLESWWRNVYITTAEGEYRYHDIYNVELGDNEAMEIVLTRTTSALQRPRLHISRNSDGSYSYFITES